MAAAMFAIVLDCVQAAQQAQILHRRPHHLYLCRRELLPNPCAGTPWQRLLSTQEDHAFITTMGFDVVTFRKLLEGPEGFGARWETMPIPRNDVSSAGGARGHRRSLDGAGALGLILHYLGSAMHKVSLQQIFALCHGLCSVTFFPKNNQRMAPMMAASPLFSATFTTGHPCRTYIGPPLEYFPTPIPPTNLHSYYCHYQPAPCATLPQHNQSPTMLHTCSMSQANHIAHAPVLEVMGFGCHKDL